MTTSYGDYIITTDKGSFFPEQIHQWLSTESYWCKNIPFEVVQKSIEHSFCIGVIREAEQVGFARLITDYATFGYLADVYVKEEYQGKGLSKKMMDVLLNLDWVKGLRRISLATLDAHGLYEQYGFTLPKFPDRLMEITRPQIYEGKEKETA